MKEGLLVAARALQLTIQPWEVRGTNHFDRVFAAMGKQRPDGVYAPSDPRMRANQKRIVGFALKSRLPSTYAYREAVDAGGLMSYGADQADSYRRVASYVDKILKAREASRSAGGAANEVWVSFQSQDRKTDRPDDTAVAPLSTDKVIQ